MRSMRGYDELRPRLKFHGVSSGALVSLALALDVDIPAVFEHCVQGLDALNARTGGWIGAYSATIRGIVEAMCSFGGGESAYKRASGQVDFGVTTFEPFPVRRQLGEFASNEALVRAVLATCYIPVVWEETVWLRGLGFCLDGAASGFMVDGDVVVGPYHSGHPDIYPPREFPRQLVFKPVAMPDLLRLFEEGWRDAAQWAKSGGPMAREARQRQMAVAGFGMRTLLQEGAATFLEVVGLRRRSSTRD